MNKIKMKGILFRRLFEIEKSIEMKIPVDMLLSNLTFKPQILICEFEDKLKIKHIEFLENISLEEFLKNKFGEKIASNLSELL